MPKMASFLVVFATFKYVPVAIKTCIMVHFEEETEMHHMNYHAYDCYNLCTFYDAGSTRFWRARTSDTPKLFSFITLPTQKISTSDVSRVFKEWFISDGNHKK